MLKHLWVLAALPTPFDALALLIMRLRTMQSLLIAMHDVVKEASGNFSYGLDLFTSSYSFCS